MKQTNNRQLLALAALVLLTVLAGCRTGRNVEDKAARIKKQQQYEQLAELAKPQQGLTDITAYKRYRLQTSAKHRPPI